MCVTVGLKISGISTDELPHVCYWGLEISGISVEELRHAVIGWFEISCISKDELGHEYYCGVGDLKYI
jgi:hypothetical protein